MTSAHNKRRCSAKDRDFDAEARRESDDALQFVIRRLETLGSSLSAQNANTSAQLHAYRAERRRRDASPPAEFDLVLESPTHRVPMHQAVWSRLVDKAIAGGWSPKGEVEAIRFGAVAVGSGDAAGIADGLEASASPPRGDDRSCGQSPDLPAFLRNGGFRIRRRAPNCLLPG